MASAYRVSIGAKWKFASAAFAYLMLSVSANAQPDSVRIDKLLNDGGYYVLKPGNEQKDLDSAMYFFDRAFTLSQSMRSDKWVNATLLWKGDCYLEGNRLALGEACFQKVIDFYHRKGDRRSEAATWARLGQCITLFNSNFSAEKAKCYEKASQLYGSNGDTLNALEALKNGADARLYVPDLDLAEKELLAVAEGYKAIHFPHLYYTYDLLMRIAELRGDVPKSIIYSIDMIQSVDSVEASKDPGLTGYLYCRAGIAYARAGMDDQGLIYSRKAWDLLKRSDRVGSCYSNMTFVAADLVEMDSARQALNFISTVNKEFPPTDLYQNVALWIATGNCYRSMGEYGKAEQQYLKLAAYIERKRATHLGLTGDENDRDINLSIGKFYLVTHRYRKAEVYAKRLYGGPADRFSLEQRVRIESFLSRLDSSLGRYRSALRHFESYKWLTDSLFGVQKAVQIQELQIKYAVGQKDRDLRLQAASIQLLTNQNQLQQVQTEKFRILRNVMILGLLSLLLLVGLVYSRYRLKQQKSRELEIKQEEITGKNHRLQRLLDENEWLLREVHHRVKNNLQVIMSLLESQSTYLHDEGGLKVIMESQHRIYAMSLIHQKLYKSNDALKIGMPEYVGDLIDYLRDSFEVPGKILFDVQVQPIHLDVHQAVPVGLILNEVITNSFKYAFPWSGNDRVTVRLSVADGWVTLHIADNGRGLPGGFDVAEHDSFGMLLIRGLTEDLDGILNLDSNNGTSYQISFRLEKLGNRHGHIDNGTPNYAIS